MNSSFPPKTHKSAKTPVNVAGGEAEMKHAALDADLLWSSAQCSIPLDNSFSGSNVPVNHEAVLKYQQHDREGGVGSGRSRGWQKKSLVGYQSHASTVSDRDGVCGIVEGHLICLWTCIMWFAGGVGQSKARGLHPDLRNCFHECSADLPEVVKNALI